RPQGDAGPLLRAVGRLVDAAAQVVDGQGRLRAADQAAQEHVRGRVVGDRDRRLFLRVRGRVGEAVGGVAGLARVDGVVEAALVRAAVVDRVDAVDVQVVRREVVDRDAVERRVKDVLPRVEGLLHAGDGAAHLVEDARARVRDGRDDDLPVGDGHVRRVRRL